LDNSTLHHLPDGRIARKFVLAAGSFRVIISDLGATILGIETPDRDGIIANVVLGYPDPAHYPSAGAPGSDHYLGATCGRFANRVGHAQYRKDGVLVRLEANEGPHQLHGGPVGFSHRIWKAKAASSTYLRLELISPTGEGGWPGTLRARAEFEVAKSGSLSIDYSAVTDAPTAVNLVAHPYFNLSGTSAQTIDDHVLKIAADTFLPIDGDQLPQGEIRGVAQGPFDFREERRIGEAIAMPDSQLRAGDGYNHAFILRRERVGPAAVLFHPNSGRRLAIETDQPALQFYSGNGLAGHFGRRQGLCLETQQFPDSVNHAHFPPSWLLPGETYRSHTRLGFSAIPSPDQSRPIRP